MSHANTQLFEKTSIPKAIMQLSLPTIIGSLVTVVYSLADTFFVGLLNERRLQKCICSNIFVKESVSC